MNEQLEVDSGGSAHPPDVSDGDVSAPNRAGEASTSVPNPMSKVLLVAVVVGLVTALGLAALAGISLFQARTDLKRVRYDQQELDAGLGAEVAAAEAGVEGIQSDMARMRFAWDPQLTGQLSSLQQAAGTYLCGAADQSSDLDAAVAEFVSEEAPRQLPALEKVPGWDSQLDRSQLELAWQRCGGDGS